jgi:hypothetical protein
MTEELVFDLEKWYTTAQVVQLARQGYSPFRSLSTLYSLINNGKISVVARGENEKKKFFIQGKEIVRYAESQATTIHKSNGKQSKESSSKT